MFMKRPVPALKQIPTLHSSLFIQGPLPKVATLSQLPRSIPQAHNSSAGSPLPPALLPACCHFGNRPTNLPAQGREPQGKW